MAAPGSPLDPRCEGSNRLLRDGATLITSADHVVEALEPILRERPPVPPEAFLSEEDDAAAPLEHDDSARARIEELLGPSPAAVDDLVRLSGHPVRLVLLVLLELELAGRLERLPGNRVARRD
jgi:DNA processing protein